MSATCGPQWYNEPDEQSARLRSQELDRAVDQLRALPHGHEPEAARTCCRGVDPLAVVFDLELQRGVEVTQPHPGAIGAGVPRDVVQRLLQDPVHLDRYR